MKMVILNEREYAEKCLDTYSYGENIYATLQILAKYYYADGLRAKRIEKKLLEFLRENYPRYQSNISKWQVINLSSKSEEDGFSKV